MNSSQTPTTEQAKQAASGRPPITNRGVELSHNSLGTGKDVVSMDWLSLVLHVNMSECLRYLQALNIKPDDLQERSNGTVGYTQSFIGPGGLLIGTAPANGNHTLISLPGTACALFGPDLIGQLLSDVLIDAQFHGLRYNVTRADFAVDTLRFQAKDIANAIEHPESPAVLGVQMVQKYEQLRGGAGLTVYLGAPSSSKRMRIYHKTNGTTYGEDTPFTRLELQFRGKHALHAVKCWHQAKGAEIGQLVKGWLIALIDLPGVSWWETFTEGLPAIKLSMPKVTSDVMRSAKWIDQQVPRALTLAAIGLTGGDNGKIGEFLEGLIYKGQEKLTKRDWKAIQRYWSLSPGNRRWTQEDQLAEKLETVWDQAELSHAV